MYQCKHAVVLIMFNRPDQTLRTLNAIRQVAPKKMLIISDGPRPQNESDPQLVNKCRSLISTIDWECKVDTNYADANLGCMRRINTGLDWAFSLEEDLIIIEDDCCPTVGFFKFLDWGLDEYRNNEKIGMISGSNLIDYYNANSNRNGYSQLINIWGWGTWRRVWQAHNQFLSLYEIKKSKRDIKNTLRQSWQESFYWTQIFKNAVILGYTWDFQLQHFFFKRGLISVYPTKNLVLNIGFDKSSTHTDMPIPEYVKKSLPQTDFNIIDMDADDSIVVDKRRDKVLVQTIWSYSPTSALRVWVTNLFRFLSC